MKVFRRRKLVTVKVTTMDCDLRFQMEMSTLGRDVFDSVCNSLGIREKYYFGLQYIDLKQISCWLMPSEKFYPEDVSEQLVQSITIHMFFLQALQSIVSGDVYCGGDEAVLLASYAVQAKLGDVEDVSGSIDINEFLPAIVIKQHSYTTEQWRDRIVRFGASVSREEAEMEYVRIVQERCEMWGIIFYQITNKKNSKLALGVHSNGLLVYHPDNKLEPKLGFYWFEIKHFSFKGKKFEIKLDERGSRVERRNQPREDDFIFFTADERISKIIFDLCVGNHDLYLKRRLPDSTELQQLKAQVREERARKQFHWPYCGLNNDTVLASIITHRSSSSLISSYLRNLSLAAQREREQLLWRERDILQRELDAERERERDEWLEQRRAREAELAELREKVRELTASQEEARDEITLLNRYARIADQQRAIVSQQAATFARDNAQLKANDKNVQQLIRGLQDALDVREQENKHLMETIRQQQEQILRLNEAVNQPTMGLAASSMQAASSAIHPHSGYSSVGSTLLPPYSTQLQRLDSPARLQAPLSSTHSPLNFVPSTGYSNFDSYPEPLYNNTMTPAVVAANHYPGNFLYSPPMFTDPVPRAHLSAPSNNTQQSRVPDQFTHSPLVSLHSRTSSNNNDEDQHNNDDDDDFDSLPRKRELEAHQNTTSTPVSQKKHLSSQKAPVESSYPNVPSSDGQSQPVQGNNSARAISDYLAALALNEQRQQGFVRPVDFDSPHFSQQQEQLPPYQATRRQDVDDQPIYQNHSELERSMRQFDSRFAPAPDFHQDLVAVAPSVYNESQFSIQNNNSVQPPQPPQQPGQPQQSFTQQVLPAYSHPPIQQAQASSSAPSTSASSGPVLPSYASAMQARTAQFSAQPHHESPTQNDSDAQINFSNMTDLDKLNAKLSTAGGNVHPQIQSTLRSTSVPSSTHHATTHVDRNTVNAPQVPQTAPSRIITDEFFRSNTLPSYASALELVNSMRFSGAGATAARTMPAMQPLTSSIPISSKPATTPLQATDLHSIPNTHSESQTVDNIASSSRAQMDPVLQIAAALTEHKKSTSRSPKLQPSSNELSLFGVPQPDLSKPPPPYRPPATSNWQQLTKSSVATPPPPYRPPLTKHSVSVNAASSPVAARKATGSKHQSFPSELYSVPQTRQLIYDPPETVPLHRPTKSLAKPASKGDAVSSIPVSSVPVQPSTQITPSSYGTSVMVNGAPSSQPTASQAQPLHNSAVLTVEQKPDGQPPQTTTTVFDKKPNVGSNFNARAHVKRKSPKRSRSFAGVLDPVRSIEDGSPSSRHDDLERRGRAATVRRLSDDGSLHSGHLPDQGAFYVGFIPTSAAAASINLPSLPLSSSREDLLDGRGGVTDAEKQIGSRLKDIRGELEAAQFDDRRTPMDRQRASNFLRGENKKSTLRKSKAGSAKRRINLFDEL